MWLIKGVDDESPNTAPHRIGYNRPISGAQAVGLWSSSPDGKEGYEQSRLDKPAQQG